MFAPIYERNNSGSNYATSTEVPLGEGPFWVSITEEKQSLVSAPRPSVTLSLFWNLAPSGIPTIGKIMLWTHVLHGSGTS